MPHYAMMHYVRWFTEAIGSYDAIFQTSREELKTIDFCLFIITRPFEYNFRTLRNSSASKRNSTESITA